MMESVIIGESKLSPSAAGKKLKQSRLPFQVLSGSPVTPTAPKTGESRKRKPSVDTAGDGGGAARAAKIGRISEVKENVKDAGAITPLVVLDDESNSTDLVDIRKEDQKLVAVKVDIPKTPIRDEVDDLGGVGAGSGESAKKNDKIMIKLPMSKKKGKKEGTTEEGSSKKKVVKGKKKHKKEGKPQKASSGKSEVEQEDPIMVDDSDLSDGENEQEKAELVMEAEMAEKDAGIQINKEEVSKDSEKAAEDPDNENKSEPTEKQDDQEIVEEPLLVDKPPEKKIPDIVVIADDLEKDETTTNNTVVASNETAPTEAVTPRRARLSRVASQKTEDDKIKLLKTPTSQKKSKKAEENSTPKSTKADAEPSEEDAAKPSKSSKKKTASAKKTESTTKEKESPKSAEEDKKPTKGGTLDKFIAKTQPNQDTKLTEKTEPKADEQPQEPKQESQKTPEKVAKPEASGDSDQKSNPNNSTIVSICLDDSSDGGNTADDEENAYMLCTPNSKERSLLTAEEKSELQKKLTPKQLARRREAERRQALKQQELDERKRKRQEEKDARHREREEQEMLRKKEREEKEEQRRKEREEKEEQKRKEKEEKEEQRRKERDEKEKKRLAELEAKNEEKRKKEEQKEEERRKKEEEKEAEEKRKQKVAQAFQSFFVKKSNGKDCKHSEDENSMDQQQLGDDGDTPKQTFMPFCVKGDMRLAPLCRTSLDEERKKRLDEMLKKSNDENGNDAEVVDKKQLYLAQLKGPNYTVGKFDRTWVAQEDETEDDDVIFVDESVCHQIEVDPDAAPAKRYRAKYFLFEENRRPPYKGTWRKRSDKIRARRPFVQDTKFFDYEVDSDDEWEEEEPGESLHGSDDEKDVDTEEDYEVDNDFFVPHGHLSDEEMQAEDDVMDDNSPETQKAKLKIMQMEFAAEMKKKTEKIKPRLIGCIWENASADGDQRSECSSVIWDILKARAMLFDPEEPISFTAQKADPESNQSSPNKDKETVDTRLKKVKLVDEGVKELIKLVHGSAQNKKFLVKEFLAYWAKRRDEGEFNVPLFAPDSIRAKIVEISSWRPCPDEGSMQNKMCWYVHKDTLIKYQLADIAVPTDWQFILKPIAKTKKKVRKAVEETKNGEKTPPKSDENDEKTPPKKESPAEKDKKERLQPPTNSAVKSKLAPASSIAKFTKKLSADDKQKQFAKAKKSDTPVKQSVPPAKSSSSSSIKRASSSSKAIAASATATSTAKTSSSTNGTAEAKPQQKKRVQLLMSVPKGQTINESLKSNLISQFLAKGSNSASRSKPAEPMEVDPPNNGEGQSKTDEVIVLDD
ncbi:chromatin assembly factor 1 subunit A [Topomyia yanbarensis]|uniref:chromatin assembly factor 1 subunit A n=1 Tax=Topomyia yanbarensis TaxID=2498891 RepID=UPI00273C0031|nr:chromatin assembly factor 1 subunit A [Topomyia yanbarensis]